MALGPFREPFPPPVGGAGCALLVATEEVAPAAKLGRGRAPPAEETPPPPTACPPPGITDVAVAAVAPSTAAPCEGRTGGGPTPTDAGRGRPGPAEGTLGLGTPMAQIFRGGRFQHTRRRQEARQHLLAVQVRAVGRHHAVDPQYSTAEGSSPPDGGSGPAAAGWLSSAGP